MKIRTVVLGAAICSLSFLTKDALSFQPGIRRPLPSSARWRSPSSSTATIATRYRIRDNKQSTNILRLDAFGGNQFPMMEPPPPTPITNTRDILERLKDLVTSTAQKFISGWMSGYLLGNLWSVLRGATTSATGASRGMIWGMDFGFLSALFSGTTAVAQLVQDLQDYHESRKKDKERKKKQTSNLEAKSQRQQAATLWSTVVRNMILSMYFMAKDGGWFKKARIAVLYGGLTYFFVSQKMKRDAAMPQRSAQNSVAMQQLLQQMMMSGSKHAPPSGGGATSSLEQLIQQMAARQQATTNSSASTSTSTSMSAKRQSSAKKKPRTPAPENVVDVEFEKLDGDAEEGERRP